MTNMYGQMAQKHMQEFLPTRFAQLEDPETYFRTLGEQAEARIAELGSVMAGPDLPGEDYFAKVGRLNAARSQAKELVLAEMVLLTPEPEEGDERAEWESVQEWDTTALVNWAWAMKIDDPDEYDRPATVTDQAEAWMLPESFLTQLVNHPSPLVFAESNQQLLLQAADRRWARYQATQQ